MVDVDIKDAQVVWPEKFDEKGRVRSEQRWDLPFQIIEAVNETRATRETGSAGRQSSLFDVWSGDSVKVQDSGWKNKLIWGDNKYVMSALLHGLGGKVDLIYIDPPFNTGDDFSRAIEIGDEEVTKEPSAIEVKAYRDTWGKGTSSYLDMMYDRLYLMKDLLSPSGSVYIHLDYNVSHYVKVLMDEIFGRENFRNEITWRRTGAHGPLKTYGPIHDTILFYSKSAEYLFNIIKRPYMKGHVESRYTQDSSGRLKFTSGGNVLTGAGATEGESGQSWRGFNPSAKNRHWAIPGFLTEQMPDEFKSLGVLAKLETLYKKGLIEIKEGTAWPTPVRYLSTTDEGQPLQDIWAFQPYTEGTVYGTKEGIDADVKWLGPTDPERLDFPTQKPEGLLERIITSSTNEGAIVADFFCGSGTTITVAERLRRRWIGCDLSRFAIHTTRKRLLNIKDCRPFEILNLGKYERQIWQGLSFSGKQGQSVIYDYLAFILKLYDAQPISGFQSIHGRRGPALVHVGSVDAPVTIDEVMAAVGECELARQSELHVLGWEWEMGIHDLVETEAKKKDVKVLLKQIPSDVMDPQVSKEDVHFFDLAYVQAKATTKKTSVQVELQDFGIPSSDLIRDEVREKIRHWSDLIDYWAVDFDFKNDTFINSWQTYRTQDNPKLELKSASHGYEKHGEHRVLVKVVDIFGIDSSKLLEVEV